MRRLHLAIQHPCHEEWNSMTGSEQQRHCMQCDKHVVALAEMTPDEADALVRRSKPHSLCLRIEHDDAGTVLFRKSTPPAMSNRAMPQRTLVTLAVGASLFAGACEHSPAPSATRDPAKAESAELVKPVEMVRNEATPPGNASDAPNSPSPATDKALQTEKQPGTNADKTSADGAHSRPARITNGANTRITTGCVCAVGDRLCDCL